MSLTNILFEKQKQVKSYRNFGGNSFLELGSNLQPWQLQSKAQFEWFTRFSVYT